MPATIEGLGLRSGEIVGRTILNVGSSRGDLCRAAIAGGAARTLGVDVNAGRVEEARKQSAASAQTKAEFVEADFETWESSEEFDLVICSNVLHRLIDPVHALRRMMRMAREQVIVEFPKPGLADVRRFHVSPASLLGFGSSLIAPAFPRYNTETYSRTFLFTPSAIRTLFDRHSAAFEPVQVRPSRRGYYAATARRRRIDRLTVIAGPTAAGKGTLYRALDAGLRGKLGVPLSDSGYVTASLVRTLPPGPHSHVIMHYDMLRPFETSLQTYERDLAADLIRSAQSVTFLTIFADPERLQRQISASEIDNRSPAKRSERHLKIRELYKDPAFVASWYRRWLAFCDGFKGKTVGSYFLHNRGEYTIVPATADTLNSLLASAGSNDRLQRKP